MGVRGLTKYVKHSGLYDVVDLQAVANDFRSRNDGDPLIAVDGVPCVWYLYRKMDAAHPSQYKEFRERCEQFVKQFRDIGIELAFVFVGLPAEEKISAWLTRKDENAKGKLKVFGGLRLSEFLMTARFSSSYLPEAMVHCASVTFKQIGCEVRQSTTDCDTELAQLAARNKRCIGVLSNDSDFMIYGDVPCLFTFSELEMGQRVTGWRFRSSDIASHLGIQVEDLPVFASFVGNDIVSTEALMLPRSTLRHFFGHRPVAELVAELLKRSPRGDLRRMCEFAFRDKWSEGMELIQKSIDSYKYNEGDSQKAQNMSVWDRVLKHAEAKHVSCEIPGCVFTVMKSHLSRCGDFLEDLSICPTAFPPCGQVLRGMRTRMYTVLLWDSGSGPFKVTEHLQEVLQETVEVEKCLPEGVHHPGLLELWSGPDDLRWRIFTWVILPTKDLSALRGLSPQYLVVPTAALLYLYHEAKILTRDEVSTFIIVAVSVKRFSSRQLSSFQFKIPTERAYYLETLFVRAVLHVLAVAGACGLSFPGPADCLLDAYFDGKLFHNIYSKSQNTTNPRALMAGDKSREETYSRLMNIILSSASD